jgi:hypothetical protein
MTPAQVRPRLLTNLQMSCEVQGIPTKRGHTEGQIDRPPAPSLAATNFVKKNRRGLRQAALRRGAGVSPAVGLKLLKGGL